MKTSAMKMSSSMTGPEIRGIQDILAYRQPVCRGCGEPMGLSIALQRDFRQEITWAGCYECKTRGCSITMTRPRMAKNAYHAALDAYKDGMRITL